MQEDIYAAPKSLLIHEDVEDRSKHFYVVSKKKFFLLFILTLGFYKIYWFYKNWKLFSLKNDPKIMPVARTFFMIFHVHSLFRMIGNRLLLKKVPNYASLSLESHGTLVVLLIVVDHMIDKAVFKGYGYPYLDVVSLMMLPIVALAFFKAQAAINIACDDPDGVSNDVLTGANYAWIAVGVVLWLLVMAGIFIPE